MARPATYEGQPGDERELERAHLAFIVAIALVVLLAVAVALVAAKEVVIPVLRQLVDLAT